MSSEPWIREGTSPLALMPMGLTELEQTRMIAALAVLAVLVCWALAVASDRRRRRRFAALAQSAGTVAIDETRFLSIFRVRIDGRAVDVRYQHLGKGSGSGGWTPDWYLVTAVQLQGVFDLHSADIRPRARRSRLRDSSAADFEKNFAVRDAGYPLRHGWLTDRTKQAIHDFFLADLPLEPLTIESASLVHRSRHLLRRLDRASFHAFVARQISVAVALESSLVGRKSGGLLEVPLISSARRRSSDSGWRT